MLLGDTAGEVIQWLGVPAWVVGLGIILWLWLKGVVMLTTDHRSALEEQSKQAELRITAITSEAATRIDASDKAQLFLQDRIDKLVIDRDAWREALTEESAARRAAERAAAELMEGSKLSLALLAALQRALEGQRVEGGGDAPSLP